LSSFDRARETLGRQLRELREQAGLNGKEFAARLHWQAAKVSRIETGQRTPSHADIAEWAEAAGVPGRTDELVLRLNVLDEMYATWHRQFRAGLRARQAMSLDLESRTKLLRIYEPGLVPGLLQTPDYARTVIESNVALYGFSTDVEDAVATRMERQRILYDSSRQIHFVIAEAALRHHVADAAVMRAQVDRIVTASAMSTVALGILPLDHQLPIALKAGFWIYDERHVLTETVSAELAVSEPTEIQMYVKTFRVLADIALYGDDARQKLIDVQNRFTD
jgi:transcriptional regulator with XRE-family HTH domain